MKKTAKLILSLVLPLSIILFGTVTYWRYVAVEDGPDEFLYGFPLPAICSGWHTSLSLQIFVSELVFNYLFYFTFLMLVIGLIDRYLKPITVKKYIKIGLYALAMVILLGYGFVFANPDHIFKTERDFNYQQTRSGFKFLWQPDEKMQ
ncbi:hypothetical protein [Pedobacter sp. SL55]|uniref:hypothetical protein n=1 Tax=Pedobacter sp. SL55 TaxID=2995161 RepID=UPI00226EE7F8|nr:hypothetical protein [Pedobacter sp. SL55]WAC42556.1 hypothetical protein OVA16_09440 [Pedobacter sp. SL55]